MKNLIIFIPSIEKGGVEKNFFILSNYLIKKLVNVYIVTANNDFNQRFHNKIKIICPKNKFWNNKSRLLKTLYCFFLTLSYFKKKIVYYCHFRQIYFRLLYQKF